MKIKFYWLALLASAGMIAPAAAGGHHGGGGGHSVAAPTRSGGSSFRSAPTRGFGRGRMMYAGRRFSPGGMRQFDTGILNRGDRFARQGNGPHLAQGRSNLGRQNNAAIANRRGNAGRVRNGNNLPPNWRNRVVARHSGNWHRDWDRSCDHRWNGHHCRFVNGSWFVFDLGFYPWWSYGYPYDYYGYDYYPYAYGSDYYQPYGYDEREEYDQNADQNGYGSSDADSDSSVAAVQERLARQGYYDGEIDGVLGPQTRRAIARYQRDHGQRATGDLTTHTFQAARD
jgi:putative peptidoglycan binding protein